MIVLRAHQRHREERREQDPTYKADGTEEANEAALGIAGSNDKEGERVPATSGIAWSSEPRSRDEAFQQLTLLAAYLKRVEPQHPVSYLLERAVRWTKMPLEQWLGEVIQNDDVATSTRDSWDQGSNLILDTG